MCKYASAEERATKNQKTTVRHFGFTEKVYGLPCTVRTMLLRKRHHRNAMVRISFFTGRHSSGSSPKAGCLCLYIYIYIYIYTNMKPYQNLFLKTQKDSGDSLGQLDK